MYLEAGRAVQKTATNEKQLEWFWLCKHMAYFYASARRKDEKESGGWKEGIGAKCSIHRVRLKKWLYLKLYGVFVTYRLFVLFHYYWCTNLQVGLKKPNLDIFWTFEFNNMDRVKSVFTKSLLL